MKNEWFKRALLCGGVIFVLGMIMSSMGVVATGIIIAVFSGTLYEEDRGGSWPKGIRVALSSVSPSFDVKLMTMLAREEAVLVGDGSPDFDLRILFDQETVEMEDVLPNSSSHELILRFSLLDGEGNQMDAGWVSRALHPLEQHLFSEEFASLAREVFEQIYVYRVAEGRIEARVQRDFPLEQGISEDSSESVTVVH